MTIVDRLVIALLVAVVAMMIFGARSPEQGRRPLPPQARVTLPPERPPPATPERVRRPPLVAPAATDPLLGIDVAIVKSGTFMLGTAFPVNPHGIWLTARHVANDGCEQLAMVVGNRQMLATLAFQHPEADLAVVRTERGWPAVALSIEPLAIGDTGRSFGYPTGTLGATEDTLMGRARMRLGGRLSGTAATLTWAETRRFPDTLERLSGMSGGPMFDDAGRVIGIVVASSTPRGRVITVAPEVLADAQRGSGLFAPGAAEAGLGAVAGHANALPDAAAALERASRIARLYCKVR
jgi:S1-C subfamily serine protease